MVYNMLTNSNLYSKILNANAPEHAPSDLKGKSAEVGRFQQATQWFMRVLLGQEKVSLFGQKYSFHDYLRVCFVLNVLAYAAQMASASLFVVGTVLAVLISSVARQKIAEFFARYVCRFDQLPRFMQTAATALQTLAQRIGLMSILGITVINGTGMSISDDSDCGGSVCSSASQQSTAYSRSSTGLQSNSSAVSEGTEMGPRDNVSTHTNGSVKSPGVLKSIANYLSPSSKKGNSSTYHDSVRSMDDYYEVEDQELGDQADRLQSKNYVTPKREDAEGSSASEKTPLFFVNRGSVRAAGDEACTRSDASGAGPKEQSNDVAEAHESKGSHSRSSSLSSGPGSF